MVDHSRRVRINPAQPLSIEIIIRTPYVLFPLTLPSPSMGARPVRSLCDRTLRGRPQSGRPGRGLRRVGEAQPSLTRSWVRGNGGPTGSASDRRPRRLKREHRVGAENQAEGQGGDGDLAERADDEGADALLAHLAEIGHQPDPGESEHEGPAR